MLIFELCSHVAFTSRFFSQKSYLIFSSGQFKIIHFQTQVDMIEFELFIFVCSISYKYLFFSLNMKFRCRLKFQQKRRFLIGQERRWTNM